MAEKVYFFDLDGTLLDSMVKGWQEVLYSCLDKRGVTYPNNLLDDIMALGLTGVSEYYHEHFLPDISPEELMQEFFMQMKKEYSENIPLKPNVREFLLAKKAEGKSLNVLTGGNHYLFDDCLKRLGIDVYFDHIWSTDDLGMTKSNAQIYRKVAEIVNVSPSDCVMVDDSIYALKAAKAAGFKTVGVYDGVSKGMQAQMQAFADRYVYDLGELL